MLSIDLKESFLSIIRLGIGHNKLVPLIKVDWKELEVLAVQQGLLDIIFDGVEKLQKSLRPPKIMILQWYGRVMQDEARYVAQYKASVELALLFHKNHVRTYVLKGLVVAECYPQPSHRLSCDLDCFLLPQKGIFDAYGLGNDLIKAQGITVNNDFYKNSTFCFHGLTVENHRFMIPFRGNKRLKNLEIELQEMLDKDKCMNIFQGTWLYRPPVMVSAIFLIEHSYSHFLHEGLTWKHVLDWFFFSRKYYSEICWLDLEKMIDKYGFRKFYDSFSRLGEYLVGELAEVDLSKRDKRMLSDIWNELDVHDSVRGLKGKLALVGNTWRARWKYHYFAEISMFHALWIQVCGFLFDKHPRLN